jgi:hypothetical protein
MLHSKTFKDVIFGYHPEMNFLWISCAGNGSNCRRPEKESVRLETFPNNRHPGDELKSGYPGQITKLKIAGMDTVEQKEKVNQNRRRIFSSSRKLQFELLATFLLKPELRSIRINHDPI